MISRFQLLFEAFVLVFHVIFSDFDRRIEKIGKFCISIDISGEKDNDTSKNQNPDSEYIFFLSVAF